MPPSHLRRVLNATHRPSIDRAVVVVVVDLPRVGVARQVAERTTDTMVNLALIVVLAQPSVDRRRSPGWTSNAAFQAPEKESVSSSARITETFDSSAGSRFAMGGSANTT
jgi:hypothetical protein